MDEITKLIGFNINAYKYNVETDVLRFKNVAQEIYCPRNQIAINS